MNLHNPPDSVSAMRNALKAIVDSALVKNPAQFGEQMIKQKWGADIDPQTASLVTLDYDYHGHPIQDGIEQGQVASSRSLVQALVSNYQDVGDGNFHMIETAFGLYTPPDIGPSVRIVEKVDEFAFQGSGNHKTYEGIYRATTPQIYGPRTQIGIRPADFKKWVWELDFKELYRSYLDKTWPTDETILGSKPYAIRTSTKAAFVMAAWLQRQENCLSAKGLNLAMLAAGLPAEQTWESLTIAQLQAPTRLPEGIEATRLRVYRYTATDIWCYRDRGTGRILLYVPGNSSPLHEFAGASQLRRWIVEQGRAFDTKQALASHFAEDDRHDGTFHAGVLTALDGMADFPHQHRLTKEAGLFNNDGYWDPVDYIGFDLPGANTDPFAQLVLTMKQACNASIETIRDNAQVNRDNLHAVIEPLVRWVNQFGPLALFVPGGEGLLALAGLIDAGYGLDQAVNGETAQKRSDGISRSVFGLLNALPLAAGVASLSHEEAALARAESIADESSTVSAAKGADAIGPAPVRSTLTREDLLRGIGAPVGTFSDEVLAQIAKVSAVDDDMLRLMQAGREPTPLLADTIERFRIDQEVTALVDSSSARSEMFNTRYQSLQKSEYPWVRVFQRQYPGLPKAAVEQMLDRYGVDFSAPPDISEARQLFSRLDSKARQYQQHVRLNRAYEGLFLRSITNADSDTLALHSMKNLPGWPRGLRLEVREGSVGGRLLDHSGPLNTTDCRILIRSGGRYLHSGLATQSAIETDLQQAIVDVLSDDERSALQLYSTDPATELKLKVSERLLSREELALGLARMDSRLPFEPQGLRGGVFPDTLQNEALTHHGMRLQLKEIYPGFSNEDADSMLQRLGSGAQAHIDNFKRQLQQLHLDLDTWYVQVWVDIYETDIPFLRPGDPAAAGRTTREIALHNFDLLQATAADELQSREELGDELIAILQKRDPQPTSHYSGNHAQGFTMNMSHENYHRLPELNVRFNDVIELNLLNFHLIERETLNGFIERFANLRTLNLQGMDLRLPMLNGQLESVLPPTIPQLQHLVSLNLRSTHLVLQESTAGQLAQLVNLQWLDLSHNPLGVPPVLIGMSRLRTLNLSNTGITRCPIGISDQPYLTGLDLSGNQIRRVPQAILNQAVARDRVLLEGNPITDEDTLQRLVLHRQQTGINLWLNSPGVSFSDPTVWLRDLAPEQQASHLQIWHRLALKPSGMRFLGVINSLSLTPDFLVGYTDLQARVWRLLRVADASDELWEQMMQIVPRALASTDNPFVVFSAMEDRARLHVDWVAMGQPFPVGVQHP
ncbi:TPA: hypothetical protein SAN82_001962 [Pseudomonas putida]|nr:hypothetical protein [Pseudomonas putida]